MNDNEKYSYEILGKINIASVKLGENVLGGNDALLFTSCLNEISQKGVKFVIIDLKSVDVMNSSGLGMLVSGLSTLKKHEIEMVLVSVPHKVKNLLKMTHLDKIFKIFNNIEDAVEAL